MGNNRFKLLNILPKCCLSKLKRLGNRSRSRKQTIQNSINKSQAPKTPATDSSSSPPNPISFTNRPSYYIPSQTRTQEKLLPFPLNPIKTKKPKARKKDKETLLYNRGSRRKLPLMSSPRASRRKVQSLSKEKQRLKQSTVVIVKFSSDPQKDFRESMVEMIMENDLSDSKDLEDLLACYLSLNLAEYHDMIVEVFEEIWIALTEDYIVALLD